MGLYFYHKKKNGASLILYATFVKKKN